MKIIGKITTFALASVLSGSCFSAPLNHTLAEPIFVSVAVYDEVPEGYTGIYTIDDLYAVRNNLSGKYILMNDIDLSETAPGGDWDNGNGWKPIGDDSSGYFEGVFDGNGYKITNMHIYGDFGNKEAILGLFGYIGAADLRRIAVVDCDIDVSGSGELYVGSVIGCFDVGYNYVGYLQRCYSTGNIKVTHTGNHKIYVGGICGDFVTHGLTGKPSSLFNTCEISVNSSSDYAYVGGIGGYCYGCKMTQTYNAGKINYEYMGENSPSKYIGNIEGYPSGASNSNSNKSYYLKTLSDYTAFGNNVSDDDASNVTGLTEAQMKSQSAFIGFDFDNVWTIDPNAEYPYPTLREVPYVSSSSSGDSGNSGNTGSSLMGDMNGDGLVDAVDASYILQYYAYVSTGGTLSPNEYFSSINVSGGDESVI